MKKVCSIIALSSMTLSLSSFNSQNELQTPHDDCSEEAADVQLLYLSVGYSFQESFEAANEYYDFCMDEESPALLTDADLN